MYAIHKKPFAWMLTLTALAAGQMFAAPTKASRLHFDAARINSLGTHSFFAPNLVFEHPEPFTVEGWIRLDAISAVDILYSFHDQNYREHATGARTMYEFGLQNGQVFAWGNDSDSVVASSATVTAGVWHHLAFSIAENWASVTLFLDGVEVGSGIFDANRGRANSIRIGGGRDAGTRHLTGAVRRVRFWDHARDATQIASTMYASLSGSEPGLAAAWPLDEGVGSKVFDKSPNGYDLEYFLYGKNLNADGWRHLTLSDLHTGSTEFTGANTVNVALLPAPPGYTHVEFTESDDPASLTGNWVAITSMPESVTFTTPAVDTTVTLYAWLTNTSASLSLPLKYAEGGIVYTSAEPQALAHASIQRETAGFTVRIGPEDLNAGSIGGLSGSQQVPIVALTALAENPSDDATPEAPYVTLTEPGSYELRLKVVNAIGAVATSAVCTVVLQTAADPPTNGNRYVAVGNLNADPPYTTWTTAAPSIQDALNEAVADDTIRVWPGRYTVPTNAVTAHGASNIAHVTLPVVLQSAGPAEATLIDGEGLHRGLVVAIASADSAFVLDGFTVTNSLAERGGGVYSANFGQDIYRNCRFIDNSAIFEGGAMYNLSRADIEIADSHFIQNRARALSGGAIFRTTGDRRMWIRDSRFEANTANDDGYQTGGAMRLARATNRLENVTLIDNAGSSSPGNAATIGGTIDFSGSSSLIMRNCLVAGGRGYSGQSGGIGSGSGTNQRLELYNCTFTRNANRPIWMRGGASNRSGDAFVYNTIIHDNIHGVNDLIMNFPSFWNYHLYHNCLKYDANIPDFAARGNIDADPRFVDSDAGNFRLLRDSPCINAGTNLSWMAGAVDLDGKARIDGISGQVDIGAFEYQYAGSILMIR